MAASFPLALLCLDAGIKKMDSNNQSTDQQNWTRNFFTIWFGQAFSILGSQLVSFALVWWLTKETGSAMVLASSTIMIYLPQIFLGPFVGALVDRWNRRLILMIADGTVALATLLLAFLFWQGWIQIWHIYVLVFIRSLGGTFHFPAMQASTTMLVPEKHLSRIAGVNQILEGGVRIAGPALGALLMELLPIQGVLSIDVITAALAISPLFFIDIPQPKNGKPKQKITPRLVLDDVVEGARFVLAWKGFTILLGMAIFLNFIFTPAGSFIPLLVTEHFKGGVWQLGLLESISGAGMLIGGVLLSVWGGFKKRVYNILLGMGVMGFSAAVVGFSPANAFFLAAAAFFIEGVANTVMNGSAFALMQAIIAADMQGRVFSMLGAVTAALSPLGLLLAAPIVENFGPRLWFVIAGVSSVLMAVASIFIPPVLNLEEHSPVDQDSLTPVQEMMVSVGEKS
jgi:DHA3 family macrolide efflux protein-like MFS transporter